MPTDPLLRGGDVDFHGPSPILGPDGKPYRRDLTAADKRLLGQEVAGPQLMGTRQFWGESVASGMTPNRLAGLLQGAAQGDAHACLTLAEEMEERDLNYGAALATRKRALSHIRPSLDCTGVAPDVVEAVRQVVEDDAFHSMVKDAVDALGKGYSVNEIVWGMKGGLWWPWGYRYRDPRFFTFDYLSKSELRIADMELIDGYEMPPAKFIRHIPKMKSGIPIRGGIARTVAWAWMFKSFALKDWVASATAAAAGIVGGAGYLGWKTWESGIGDTVKSILRLPETAGRGLVDGVKDGVAQAKAEAVTPKAATEGLAPSVEGLATAVAKFSEASASLGTVGLMIASASRRDIGLGRDPTPEHLAENPLHIDLGPEPGRAIAAAVQPLTDALREQARRSAEEFRRDPEAARGRALMAAGADEAAGPSLPPSAIQAIVAPVEAGVQGAIARAVATMAPPAPRPTRRNRLRTTISRP